MRTLVLGLGNPILSDDAVGLHVADAVAQQIDPARGVEVDTDYWGGLRLMERLVGYERAYIIDAICSGAHEPGTIMELGVEDVPTQHSGSAHDVNLPTALLLASTMGLPMPHVIKIIGIEAENVLDLGECLSPAVAAAVPKAAKAVLDSIVAEDAASAPVQLNARSG
jgi:hydrogenase maturation protease